MKTPEDVAIEVVAAAGIKVKNPFYIRPGGPSNSIVAIQLHDLGKLDRQIYILLKRKGQINRAVIHGDVGDISGALPATRFKICQPKSAKSARQKYEIAFKFSDGAWRATVQT